jgi:hypothetical protein
MLQSSSVTGGTGIEVGSSRTVGGVGVAGPKVEVGPRTIGVRLGEGVASAAFREAGEQPASMNAARAAHPTIVDGVFGDPIVRAQGGYMRPAL